MGLNFLLAYNDSGYHQPVTKIWFACTIEIKQAQSFK